MATQKHESRYQRVLERLNTFYGQKVITRTRGRVVEEMKLIAEPTDISSATYAKFGYRVKHKLGIRQEDGIPGNEPDAGYDPRRGPGDAGTAARHARHGRAIRTPVPIYRGTPETLRRGGRVRRGGVSKFPRIPLIRR